MRLLASVACLLVLPGQAGAQQPSATRATPAKPRTVLQTGITSIVLDFYSRRPLEGVPIWFMLRLRYDGP